MKLLAIASLALAANVAVGAESLSLYGYGTDRESAKRDAFRTASQNICGVAILDDREHFNGKTTHNKTNVYSSCRIVNYRIIKDELSEKERLLINVTVEDTRQSGRLFNKPYNREVFNGDVASENIHSYVEEKKLGDELVSEIFRDYPYHAYNLDKSLRPYITDDPYRNIYLVVPYKVTWNKNFIYAMKDTFSAVSNKDGRYGHIQVGNKVYYMDDLTRLNHIKNQITGDNEMRLQLNIRDTSGNRIVHLCYSPVYKQGGIFYSVGVDRQLTIFGTDTNRGEIKLKLTVPAEVIYDISLDVVAERDCKLYAPPL